MLLAITSQPLVMLLDHPYLYSLTRCVFHVFFSLSPDVLNVTLLFFSKHCFQGKTLFVKCISYPKKCSVRGETEPRKYVPINNLVYYYLHWYQLLHKYEPERSAQQLNE